MWEESHIFNFLAFRLALSPWLSRDTLRQCLGGLLMSPTLKCKVYVELSDILKYRRSFLYEGHWSSGSGKGQGHVGQLLPIVRPFSLVAIAGAPSQREPMSLLQSVSMLSRDCVSFFHIFIPWSYHIPLQRRQRKWSGGHMKLLGKYSCGKVIQDGSYFETKRRKGRRPGR